MVTNRHERGQNPNIVSVNHSRQRLDIYLTMTSLNQQGTSIKNTLRLKMFNYRFSNKTQRILRYHLLSIWHTANGCSVFQFYVNEWTAYAARKTNIDLGECMTDEWKTITLKQCALMNKALLERKWAELWIVKLKWASSTHSYVKQASTVDWAHIWPGICLHIRP